VREDRRRGWRWRDGAARWGWSRRGAGGRQAARGVEAAAARAGEAKAPVVTVALAGNPNSGKTTIFNAITGAHQHVGNYGGVTVEVKEGDLRRGDTVIKIVDLPGTYSLTPYSPEERVARDYLLENPPDVVIDIIDGSNLERSLYLTCQLKELGLPLVVALNMADEMKKKGIRVDVDLLSRQLGAPVVPTVGTRGKGIRKLLETAGEIALGQSVGPESPPVRYGAEVEAALQPLTALASAGARETLPGRAGRPVPARWLAVALLENEAEALPWLAEHPAREAAGRQARQARQCLQSLFGEAPETLLAEQRYGYVHGICRAAVQRPAQRRIELTDRLDQVLTHRALGLPIFAALMYATFYLVFRLGAAPVGWLEAALRFVGERVNLLWPAGRVDLLRSLLVDGVLAGVGNVVVFLPNIMLLFAAITLLEDTGYMARAAFLMDRVMKWVGLHGKSFIPMLTGFGCTVPAILATRVLESRRARLTTMLVLPLMSCGARLPIYTLLIPAFFRPEHQAAVMYGIYLLGIGLAVVLARLLRSTLFRGEAAPFVMELPPYRLPTGRAVALHVWQRSWLYLRKAGTIILGFSVLMWALTTFPRLPEERRRGLGGAERAAAQVEYSLAGRAGRALAPVVRPLGFDWRIATALVGAIPAKELFVSQLAIVYAVSEASAANGRSAEATVGPTAGIAAVGKGVQQQDGPSGGLRQQLRASYSPLVGLGVLVFCLVATPCVATVAVMRKESGAWGWAILQFLVLTALAWILALVVHQVGSVLRLGVF